MGYSKNWEVPGYGHAPFSPSSDVTDGQTTCNLNTALCTKVYRAVKKSDAQRSAQRALQRTLTLVQSGTKLHVLGRKWRKGGMLGRGRKTLSKVKYSDAVWQTVP